MGVENKTSLSFLFCFFHSFFLRAVLSLVPGFVKNNAGHRRCPPPPPRTRQHLPERAGARGLALESAPRKWCCFFLFGPFVTWFVPLFGSL